MGLRLTRRATLLLFIAALAPACNSKTKEGPPPPPAPVAPSTFTLTPVSTGQLRLDWTDVALEAWYQIEGSADGVTYTPLTIVPADVVSYSDMGLQPSTPYYYRL